MIEEKTEVIALGGLCCCNTRKATIELKENIRWDNKPSQVVTIEFQHRDPGPGTFYDTNYFHMDKDELSKFIDTLTSLHSKM